MPENCVVQKCGNMTQDLLQSLLIASQGLEYPSESDAPFDLFHWPATSGDIAQQQLIAKVGAARKISEVPVDQFFADLDDSEDAPHFKELRRVLEATLTSLKVFRVGEGEVKVDIYLIGKMAAGDWAGLHTRSIET